MAKHWYRKRAAMGGWEEEVFYSLQRVGLALQAQGAAFNAVRSALLDAWEYRPGRAEPLCYLAEICRGERRWQQAYLFAGRAVATAYPVDDVLFVDESVWAWRAADELAIAAYWVGRFAESAELCERLLAAGKLPESQIERVRNNLDFARRNN